MLVAHDEPGARVPAKDRIVVAGGPNGFGPFIPGHGFSQPFVRPRTAARSALPELGLGASLMDDPGVIGAFVLVPDPFDDAAGVTDCRRRALVKMVADRQTV